MKSLPTTPAIYIPAAWRGAGDVLHWRTAAGSEGAGTLAELPPLTQPCLVLGWPAVSCIKAAVPPALHQHPQALAAALEEHLLQPPEEVFAVVAGREGELSLCAVVSRGLLQGVLTAMAERGIHARRAVPEVWQGKPGQVVLSNEGGWALGGDGLPLLLDRWTVDTPPCVLQCLLERDGLSGLSLQYSPGTRLPDTDFWSQTLGCGVELDSPWRWTQALHAEAPDLLRFEFRPRPAFGRSARHIWKPLLIGAVLLGLLEVGMSGADWGRLSWRQRQLQEDLTSTYRAAFPGNAPLLAPMLQARRALGDLRRGAGEWADDDFVPLATRALPLLALLPPGSLKALALEEHSLILEADGLKALETRLLSAATQAGLSARLRGDSRLAITPGSQE